MLRANGVDTPVTNITTALINTNVYAYSSTISAAGTVEAQVAYKLNSFQLESVSLDFEIGGLDVTTLVTHSSGGVTITDNTSAAVVSGTFASGTVVGVCTGTLENQFSGVE